MNERLVSGSEGVGRYARRGVERGDRVGTSNARNRGAGDSRTQHRRNHVGRRLLRRLLDSRAGRFVASFDEVGWCTIGFIAWVAFAAAGLAGCAGYSTNQQINAWQRTLLQFEDRTARLCLGDAPALSVNDCQSRLDASKVAGDALDEALTAQARCATVAACDGVNTAISAARIAMLALEGQVYGGAK